MRKSITTCLAFFAASIWSIGLAQVEFPKGLKKVVSVYSDATVLTALETAETSHVVMETGSPPEQVVAFYRKQLEGKGWKTEMEMRQKESLMLVFRKGKQTLSLLAESSAQAKATVALTLSEK